MVDERRGIPSYPGYEIDTSGNVYRLEHTKYSNYRGVDYIVRKSEYLVRFHKDRKGYLRGSMHTINGQKKELLHRLLAESFLPNPHNHPQVNHKNGDKSDCKLDNLEWVTARQNVQHGYNTGLITRTGGEGAYSKLTKEQVIDIKDQLSQGKKTSYLSEMFGVTVDNIRKIRSGKSWAHANLPI